MAEKQPGAAGCATASVQRRGRVPELGERGRRRGGGGSQRRRGSRAAPRSPEGGLAAHGLVPPRSTRAAAAGASTRRTRSTCRPALSSKTRAPLPVRVDGRDRALAPRARSGFRRAHGGDRGDDADWAAAAGEARAAVYRRARPRGSGRRRAERRWPRRAAARARRARGAATHALPTLSPWHARAQRGARTCASGSSSTGSSRDGVPVRRRVDRRHARGARSVRRRGRARVWAVVDDCAAAERGAERGARAPPAAAVRRPAATTRTARRGFRDECLRANGSATAADWLLMIDVDGSSTRPRALRALAAPRCAGPPS